MRTALAWLAGIATVLVVGLALAFLGDGLGVPISVDLDGPTTITTGSGRFSYEEEIDSYQTSFGRASTIFAFVVALWVGQAVRAGSWRAGFTTKGWYSFFAWLMATAILMVVAVVVDLAFKSFAGSVAAYVRYIIELGAVAGVGWSCHQWYANRIRALDPGLGR